MTSRPEVWRLRNWPLSTKLVATLLIPTVAVLVVLGMHLTAHRTGSHGELAAQVGVDSSIARLTHALQAERDLAVRVAASGRVDDDATQARREQVDQALGEVDNALVSSGSDLSDAALDRYQEARDRIGTLTDVRFAADHSTVSTAEMISSYTDLIEPLNAVWARTAATSTEPELVRAQLATGALARGKEQLSLTRALVSEALLAGRLSTDHARMLVSAHTDQRWWLDFTRFATPEEQRLYDGTVTGDPVDLQRDIAESLVVLAEEGGSLTGPDADDWEYVATHTVDLLREVESAMLAQAQDKADAFAAQARTSTVRDGAIVVGLLLIAALLAVIMARSMLRPLRTLRSSALEAAEYRLPAAVQRILADPAGGGAAEVVSIPVTTTEEVGQVARAFDAVHSEAVRLAADQAVLRDNINSMFVNLARRAQDLVERQLTVLDVMEADEQDPATLARLFELDHLVTRLRRVCENLLVLTGNDSTRRLDGPVPASEVIGAALSAIEEYSRVDVADVPQLAVSGDAAVDVVHVISELLENATAGSPPDTRVVVVSSVAHDGHWLVEITDDGAGMPQDAIDAANTRLAELPVVDVEATKRMGLFVVARLAHRYGLAVRLRSAPSGGLTAQVAVPSSLLSDSPASARTVSESERGRRAEWLEAAGTRPNAPAGPPRRAPVVDEPVSATAHPLDEETVTERIVAYEELLSKWLANSDQVGTRGALVPARPEPSAALPVPRPDAPERSDVPANDLDPPTVRRSPLPLEAGPPGSGGGTDAAANGVNSARAAASAGAGSERSLSGILDLESGGSPRGQAAASGENSLLSDCEQDAGAGSETAGRDAISRTPDAVKSRMSSMVAGVRRARQQKSGEYAGHGRDVTRSPSTRREPPGHELGWASKEE